MLLIVENWWNFSYFNGTQKIPKYMLNRVEFRLFTKPPGGFQCTNYSTRPWLGGPSTFIYLSFCIKFCVLIYYYFLDIKFLNFWSQTSKIFIFQLVLALYFLIFALNFKFLLYSNIFINTLYFRCLWKRYSS